MDQEGGCCYLVSLLDEVDRASQVPSEPDNGPDGRVHALGVASGSEDGDGLAMVGVGLDHPLRRRVWSIHHFGFEVALTNQRGLFFRAETQKNKFNQV